MTKRPRSSTLERSTSPRQGLQNSVLQSLESSWPTTAQHYVLASTLVLILELAAMALVPPPALAQLQVQLQAQATVPVPVPVSVLAQAPVVMLHPLRILVLLQRQTLWVVPAPPSARPPL